eukprot:4100106-Pyramimonas_sp.AAC.2
MEVHTCMISKQQEIEQLAVAEQSTEMPPGMPPGRGTAVESRSGPLTPGEAIDERGAITVEPSLLPELKKNVAELRCVSETVPSVQPDLQSFNVPRFAPPLEKSQYSAHELMGMQGSEVYEFKA